MLERSAFELTSAFKTIYVTHKILCYDGIRRTRASIAEVGELAKSSTEGERSMYALAGRLTRLCTSGATDRHPPTGLSKPALSPCPVRDPI